MKTSYRYSLVASLLLATRIAFAQTQTPTAAFGYVQPTPSAAATQRATGLTSNTTATSLALGVKASDTSDKNLRLNFHGAPLDAVLSYLSEAAGFIVVFETDVKGKVDVWSKQPVSKEEAVDLLNASLNQNGYAALRNGRTLTILNRDEAKKRMIPVQHGNDPTSIPKNEQMVTQIIPIRYANATQMTKDLQPLLPAYAVLTANESGNALVLTDVQSHVRRMVEIVRALDTATSGTASIRVFPLRFADAKDMESVVKEMFPTQNNDNSNANMQFASFFPGGMGQSQGVQGESPRKATRITAVADERTNSLIISAPADLMGTVAQLLKEIDANAENITELRVFHLTYADPLEMVDLLASLFPDDSKSDDNRSNVQFGPGGFAGPVTSNDSQSTGSKRAQQKGKVSSVADQRTSSIIVSAAKDLMPHIAQVIEQLDSNPARHQKVFIYSVKNGDANNIHGVLQDMFQSENSRSSTSSQNTDALAARQAQALQSYGQTTTRTSSSSRSSGGTAGSGLQ